MEKTSLYNILIAGDSYSGALGFFFSLPGNYENSRNIQEAIKIVQIKEIEIAAKVFCSITVKHNRIVISSSEIMNGIIVVFNTCALNDFLAAKKYIKKLKEENNQKTKFLLLGCNVHKPQNRQVTFDDAQKFSLKHKFIYTEITTFHPYITMQTLILFFGFL
jgi:hypothetical protein